MAKNAYIGVSGVARKVKQPYIGVSSVARKVTSGYIGVSGVARQFFAGGTPMNEIAVGSSVYLNENGSPVEYLVVHQGLPSSIYDESCDGTWLLRNAVVASMAFDNTGYAGWNMSDIPTWLKKTMLPKYDEAIQNIISTVKIPYIYLNRTTEAKTIKTGSNGMSCQLFILSAIELGFTEFDNGGGIPGDGTKLSYFESGTSASALEKRLPGKGDTGFYQYWTRTTRLTNNTYQLCVDGSGHVIDFDPDSVCGVRPALILPSTLVVNSDGLVEVA